MNAGDTLITLTPYIDEHDLLDRIDDEAGQEGEEYTGTGEDADPDEGEETGETDETVGEAGAMDTLQADIQALIDEMGLNENIRVIDEGTVDNPQDGLTSCSIRARLTSSRRQGL